ANGIGLESIHEISVERRAKNNGTGYRHPLKDIETRPIRKLYVGKDQVGMRIRRQPRHSLLHRLEDCDHPHAGIRRRDELHKLPGTPGLVLDDQHVHASIGSLTVKNRSSMAICISLPKRSL